MKHIKKIILSLIIVIIVFNYIVPTYSSAFDIGGILLKPTASLIAVPLDQINTYMTLIIIGLSNGFSRLGELTVKKISDALADTDTYEDIKEGDVIVVTSTGEHNAHEPKLELSTLWAWMLSMEDFFIGNIDITDINIFTVEKNETSIIKNIKSTVAALYYGLRNIAGVGLLCALIYTAIRVLLSSVAATKAHYKELLFDWIKAACLVIFIHILMILIVNISDLLLEIIRDLIPSKYSILAYVRGNLAESWDMTQIGYLIIYAMLTYYTVCFAISYFKRFFYTMILIIIAPIVSLLYAFGKQGQDIYRKWLKEFTCSVLLQPYHLLIYTILFGWVIAILEEAQNNADLLGLMHLGATILAIIVAHFIRDAEKYYRRLFGTGEGVAGIGAIDTGEKTVKEVQHKVTEAAKSVVQILTIAAAGGIGAEMGGAASASTSGELAQEAGELKSANAEIPKRLGAAPSGNNDSGEETVVPGEPEPESSILPSDSTSPLIETLDESNIKEASIDEINAKNIETIKVEDPKPLEVESTEPVKIESTEPVKTESIEPVKAESIETVEIEGPKPLEIEDERDNNEGQTESQIYANNIDVDKMSTDQLETMSKEEPEKELKLDSSGVGNEIDKLIGVLTQKEHISVEPGATPTSTREGGISGGVASSIERGREASRSIENDENLRQMSDRQKAITIANAALNGSTLEGDPSDRQGGTPEITEQGSRDGETINATNNNSASAEIDMSSSGIDEGRIEKLLKDIAKGDNRKTNEVIDKVSKLTGKTNDEVRKDIERIQQGQNRASTEPIPKPADRNNHNNEGND